MPLGKTWIPSGPSQQCVNNNSCLFHTSSSSSSSSSPAYCQDFHDSLFLSPFLSAIACSKLSKLQSVSDANKFLQVCQHWHVYVSGSMSFSLQGQTCLARIGSFFRWKITPHQTTAVLPQLI